MLRICVLAFVMAAVVGACGATERGPIPLSELPEDYRCRTDEMGVVPLEDRTKEPDPRPTGELDQSDPTNQEAGSLFETGKWAEAIPVLADVMAERPATDVNYQMAELQQAIALYNVARYREAEAVFLSIARRPGHLKRAVAGLWLLRMMFRPGRDALAIIDAQRWGCDQPFNEGDAPKEARDLHDFKTILCARAYYRVGEVEPALAALRDVHPEGMYGPLARECLSRLGGP